MGQGGMKIYQQGCKGCSIFLSSPLRAEREKSKDSLHPLHPPISQSLTPPHNLRYCTTMAPRPPEERAHALDLLATTPLSDVSRETGIPKQTLSSWAKAEGLDLAGLSTAKTAKAVQAHQRKWAEVRAELADQSGDAARRLLAIISRAIDSGDLGITSARDAKDAATAMAILIDKAQVLVGDASDIHGHLGLQAQVLEQAEQHATHLRAVV